VGATLTLLAHSLGEGGGVQQGRRGGTLGDEREDRGRLHQLSGGAAYEGDAGKSYEEGGWDYTTDKDIFAKTKQGGFKYGIDLRDTEEIRVVKGILLKLLLELDEEEENLQKQLELWGNMKTSADDTSKTDAAKVLAATSMVGNLTLSLEVLMNMSENKRAEFRFLEVLSLLALLASSGFSRYSVYLLYVGEQALRGSKKVDILTPEELLKDDFNQTHSTFLAEQEQMDYEVCRFFCFFG
jgi:hypothetical protein